MARKQVICRISRKGNLKIIWGCFIQRDAVPVPLVLHGGSGLTDDDFRQAIACGISKVNIFTDLCLAGVAGTVSGNADGIGYLETRNRKVAFIKEEVKKKILLFGSAGKA